MESSKLPLQVRIKAGLIGGFVSAILMAGFDYFDGKDFSILKFILHLVIFGGIMAVIIRPRKPKK